MDGPGGPSRPRVLHIQPSVSKAARPCPPSPHATLRFHAGWGRGMIAHDSLLRRCGLVTWSVRANEMSRIRGGWPVVCACFCFLVQCNCCNSYHHPLFINFCAIYLYSRRQLKEEIFELTKRKPHFAVRTMPVTTLVFAPCISVRRNTKNGLTARTSSSGREVASGLFDDYRL